MNQPPVRFRAHLCSLLGFIVCAAGMARLEAADSMPNPPTSGNPQDSGNRSSPRSAETPFFDPFINRSSVRNDDFGREPASRPWRLPIFYPPFPPMLGSPIPLPDPTEIPSRQDAPPELAEYVNEPFYAPLGTRLTQNQLNRALQEKINAYRTAKTALQNELRERLDALQTADPATRARELAALALAQSARLIELEKTAEQLRQELIRGEFFQGSADWNATRSWRLGKSQFLSAASAMNAQYQVMLSSAFYQSGLLPEQRGLLREIAMELNSVRRKASDEGAVGANPPLFFSPATARLRLPPGLPAALSDKIAAYEKEKSELKQELRETVYAQDKRFAATRNKAMEALAERQGPRIAALEEFAEEIRQGLARLPKPPGPPAPPPLPAAFAARVTAFLAEKSAVKAFILRKIDQIKKDFAIMRVFSGRNPGGGNDLRLVISPGAQSADQTKTLRATLAAFNQEVSLRQKELKKEEEAIRREFEIVAPRGEGHSIESLLDDYADALQEREEWLPYADYQTAVLTPGLSLRQRRLLFDGAVEKLALPLPGWEFKTIAVYE